MPAIRGMQSSSNELSILVSASVKCKQTKVKLHKTLNSWAYVILQKLLCGKVISLT